MIQRFRRRERRGFAHHAQNRLGIRWPDMRPRIFIVEKDFQAVRHVNMRPRADIAILYEL